MDRSSNPLTPDARAVERLPYAFAKRHGVISARQLEAGFELWVRPGVRAGVLAEVQRALGGPLALRELANDAFDAALARAYERGASHAADIVTDLDANQDHGAPGHRRETPAAGRTHRAPPGRTLGRRARFDPADGSRRARGAAAARQAGREARSHG